MCVVERQDKVGGGVVTRELTLPGFKHDPASIIHGLIRANPLIHQDELGLISRYGLRYITPDPQLAIVFPDQRALVIYRDIDRTCASIREFSVRDADIYPKFCQACQRMLKVGAVAMFSPPPSFGTMVSFLEASDDGREMLRAILSSAKDIAEEWFESEQMRVALMRWMAEVMIAPQEKGTGNWVLGFPFFHTQGVGVPVGGSGALSEALASSIRDNRGTIRLSSTVKAIRIKGGEAKGVTLDTGEEIIATKATVASLNVKQLFLEMVKPEELPPGFPERVKRIKHSAFSILNQAIAINEPPEYKANEDVNKAVCVEIAPSMEEFLHSFEEYVYGIPNARMPTLCVATLVDPTRAPEGKHTLYLSHYEPYNLKEGGAAKWDGIKQEIANAVLETARQYTTNLGTENILGRWIGTPLDFERYDPAFVNGDFMHIDVSVWQFFANRPLPGWGHYRTPIRKLYLCGASTHPGGGVSGGGRAAAQVIMEDLGIDFRKVVVKK